MSENKSFRLMLLRHGNTFEAGETAVQVGCQTDMPLTEKGLLQAQLFADLLKQQELIPTYIYSGSLQRQTKTADIVHQSFNTATLIKQQSALDEIDYGVWEGLTTEQILAKWPAEYKAWHEQARWPDNIFKTQLEDHRTALKLWLTQVSQVVPENGLVVAVSSNGIIRLMLQWIPDVWNMLVYEKKMDTYKVGTGHYCDLTIKDGVPTIMAWNIKPASLIPA